MLPFEYVISQEIKTGMNMRLRDRERTKYVREIDSKKNVKNKTTSQDNYQIDEYVYAFFIQDKLLINRVFTILPGIRFERTNLQSVDGNEKEATRNFTDCGPSIHLIYHPSSTLKLYAVSSRTVNRPKFDELIPYRFEKDSNTLVEGNPNILSSPSWNFDFGTEYGVKKAFLSLNIFYKNINDVIEQVDTGIDIEEKDLLRFENVGDGWLSGVELEQRISFGFTNVPIIKWLSLWGNQSFLSSEIEYKSGNKHPFNKQPNLIANGGIDYTINPTNTTLSVAINYVGKNKEYKDDRINRFDPVLMLDAGIVQQIQDKLWLKFSAKNLNDNIRRYVAEFNDGSISNGEENTGRSFLLSLNWEF